MDLHVCENEFVDFDAEFCGKVVEGGTSCWLGQRWWWAGEQSWKDALLARHFGCRVVLRECFAGVCQSVEASVVGRVQRVRVMGGFELCRGTGPALGTQKGSLSRTKYLRITSSSLDGVVW